MRRFPAPFTALLRERTVCGGLLLAGGVLIIGNALGVSLWHCAFLEVTGRPCPGCGLTRGLTALCHGEVGHSMQWHPFSPVFALGGMIMLVSWMLPAPSRERLTGLVQAIEECTGVTLWLLMALMVFGGWRMANSEMFLW